LQAFSLWIFSSAPYTLLDVSAVSVQPMRRGNGDGSSVVMVVVMVVVMN
jgi:hypothetical protein